MSDRELLELAAKAAGIDVRYIESWGGHFIHRPHKLPGEWDRWNPLANDGQSLRLAIKLGMRVRVVRVHPAHGNPRVEVACGSVSLEQSCGVTDEEYEAATRRAIVRAAAAIGKEMQ